MNDTMTIKYPKHLAEPALVERLRKIVHEHGFETSEISEGMEKISTNKNGCGYSFEAPTENHVEYNHAVEVVDNKLTATMRMFTVDHADSSDTFDCIYWAWGKVVKLRDALGKEVDKIAKELVECELQQLNGGVKMGDRFNILYVDDELLNAMIQATLATGLKLNKSGRGSMELFFEEDGYPSLAFEVSTEEPTEFAAELWTLYDGFYPETEVDLLIDDDPTILDKYSEEAVRYTFNKSAHMLKLAAYSAITIFADDYIGAGGVTTRHEY